MTEGTDSASELIDATIAELGDWRGDVLAQGSRADHRGDPEVVEEVKWRKPSNSMRGVPVWSHDGIICTGETYKDKVKLTFAKGASLDGSGRPVQLESRGATPGGPSTSSKGTHSMNLRSKH